jgi:hypothetical protein
MEQPPPSQPVAALIAAKVVGKVGPSRRPPALQVLLVILILVMVVTQILAVGTLAGTNQCLLAQRQERQELIQQIARDGGSAVDVQVRLLALPIAECR